MYCIYGFTIMQMNTIIIISIIPKIELKVLILIRSFLIIASVILFASYLSTKLTASNIVHYLQKGESTTERHRQVVVYLFHLYAVFHWNEKNMVNKGKYFNCRIRTVLFEKTPFSIILISEISPTCYLHDFSLVISRRFL